MQTLTGRAITMSAPHVREIDVLVDLPETLARIARWNGTVPAGNYSVGQHCCHIADAILDETGDAEAAAIGLLHDAHEYIWGDIITPQAEGLAEIEAELYGDSRVDAVIKEAKRRGDQAIFGACGVPWPPSPQHVRTVKAYDLRMLATEHRQLLAPGARRMRAAVEQAPSVPLRGALKIWPIAKSADEYRRRLIELCPAVARKSSER
jgi:hypothetical protein